MNREGHEEHEGAVGVEARLGRLSAAVVDSGLRVPSMR
jgi:hypothetical protein